MGIRRRVRFSDHWGARLVKKIYYLPDTLSVPCPRALVRPIVFLFIFLRSMFWQCQRIFIAEPFFKAYCTRYGKRLHTGKFLHWIQGEGEILIGDDVTIEGKCSISFAATYTAHPQLVIGDHTGISHGCSFRIGKQIVIGKYCRIAGGVEILDTPGHSSDPESRMAGAPAPDEEVRPVIIGDNVWIGRRTSIFPGVRIEQNSIIASSSSVFTDVPANTIVGGNPARIMGTVGKVVSNGYSAEEQPPLTSDAHEDSFEATANSNGLQSLTKEIAGVIQEVGRIQSLTSEDDFYDAGVSSMTSLTLMLNLEEKYKVALPDEQFIACRTASQVSLLISDLLQSELYKSV